MTAVTSIFVEQSMKFLNHLQSWMEGLQPLSMGELGAEAGGGDKVAVLSVDVINGFCFEGLLASERVARIVEPIVDLFRKAYGAGVRDFVLTQDCHPRDAPEFAQWPPHCVEGTSEAETVPQFRALPFWDRFMVFPKRSIHSAIGTGLEGWLEARPYLKALIAVGDCTDLCLYQLAMHLKLRANAFATGQQVIVPANCVQTYDLPAATALSIGAMPHDGDFFHVVFLYHLALNGIRVVKGIV